MFTNTFDEEQERELEQETEEERESDLPPPHSAYMHQLSQPLCLAVRAKQVAVEMIDWPLVSALQETSLFAMVFLVAQNH